MLNPRFLALLVFLVGVSLLYIFSNSTLNGVSSFLVYEEPLIPVDAIVVLAGSKSGNRIKTGVGLYKKKLGKLLVFSGYRLYPKVYTHDHMKTIALEMGVLEEDIVTEISQEESSTWGEGVANLHLLKKHNVKSFILVTSSFHTRRSRWVYSKLIENLELKLEFKVFPAKDPDFPVQDWWMQRGGRKMIILEYIKFLSYLIEH